MATKKTIGKIPYSLGLRNVNPGDADSAKKVYAYAQRDETVDMAALSEHIHDHDSVFSPGTINGVITDMIRCIRELLLEGNRICLPGLGTFFVTLRSRGADSAEEFTAQDITHVNVRCTIDPQLRAEINAKAEFEQVAPREDQLAAAKAAKQALNEALGVTSDTGSGNGSGSDNPGGGNSGGGGNDDNAEGQTE